MSEHNENINKIQFRLAVTYRQLSAVINQITLNSCRSAATTTLSDFQRTKINSTLRKVCVCVFGRILRVMFLLKSQPKFIFQ